MPGELIALANFPRVAITHICYADMLPTVSWILTGTVAARWRRRVNLRNTVQTALRESFTLILSRRAGVRWSSAESACPETEAHRPQGYKIFCPGPDTASEGYLMSTCLYLVSRIQQFPCLGKKARQPKLAGGASSAC